MYLLAFLWFGDPALWTGVAGEVRVHPAEEDAIARYGDPSSPPGRPRTSPATPRPSARLTMWSSTPATVALRFRPELIFRLVPH
ncbi:hypothetical protein, partial [Brevundimonas diminuta]|uniref:hypothetical protein n=1 Tax=Brevundimonas diminuta TaxID=293 RepID=UPI001CC2FFEE